ncbi:MAG: L,D-transpeptidase family protein [Oscillospiraceae bacterium]|nr:L,D-transpeptidase family protein [Oscillospiraceae bacterium]
MRKAIVGILCLVTLVLLALPAGAMPPTWAEEAMTFAVEHGILDEADCRPTDAVTRAELAGMLVRLLRAEARADLRAFTDVQPGDVHYDDLAGAVALGVLQGSGGALRPQATLTREQAITMLARCFGVARVDAQVLSGFSDRAGISDWALGPMTAMVTEGCVRGVNGRLNPQAAITQQELVQLLYNMAGGLIEDGAAPESASAVLRAGEKAPENLQLSGNLVVCGAADEAVTLRGVQAGGRIVICGGKVQLTGNCSAAEVVCAGSGVELAADGSIPIRVVSGSAVISGGGMVTADAPVTLESGTYAQLNLSGAEAVLAHGAQVEEAVLAGQAVLSGEGQASHVTLRGSDCRVTAEAGEITEAYDAGISQVRAVVAQPANEPTPGAPAVTTTVRFENVDTTGCEGGVRRCTLSWYVNGTAVEKQLDFPLYEGATATLHTNGIYTGTLPPQLTILARLSYGDETVECTQSVNQHLEQLPTPVRTLEVECTVIRNTSMYSSIGSGWMCNVPAGTYAIYINYSGTSYGKIRLADGREGWVRWSDLRISSKDYVRTTDYQQWEKEQFVNTRGYTSTTGYLVWVNLLTQKVNVFQGTAGNWKLVRTCACCSGKNTTPTIGGVFKYQYRQNTWDFGSYYVRRPMIFNGGHAFHSRTYIKGSSGLLDATMGKPASHGCVRMYDADVDWLWNNMPFGTTVVVY